jgi:hypothetical protein
MSQVDSQVELNQSFFASTDRILMANESEYYQQFNRDSFMFTHHLAGNSLFQIPRLVELAQHLITYGPGSIRCQVSGIPMDLKWTDIQLKEQFQAQIPDFLANIEKSDSWLLLYSVQRDPVYQVLLDQIVDELSELTGVPLRKEMTWLDAYIFVASPHAVTPYHIDHESTFLFQMHGDRQSNIFPCDDRTLLTDQELESFYIGDLNAATFRPEYQSSAKVYPLVPGKGVHHPVCAPHWYQNGETYSVAMGVHFGLRSFDLRARIYQVNHYLRKLHLPITPPGKSAIRNQLKIQALGLLSKRHPVTKSDVVRSGSDRLRRVINSVAAPVKYFKQRRSF